MSQWKVGEKPFMQFMSLINNDVNEASNVSHLGQGVGDIVTKDQTSVLQELRRLLGRSGEYNVRDTWKVWGALGKAAWTIRTDGGGQVSPLGRG